VGGIGVSEAGTLLFSGAVFIELKED